MDKINEELKLRINKRLSVLGIKKGHLATKIGLDSVRFSQTLNGVRKIQPEELSKLKKYLGL